MFGPPRYINWARRHFGRVEYDLATSGMARMALRDFAPPRAVDLDEPNGLRALTNATARYNGVDPSEAIPTLGTTNALWLAYACTIAPGSGDEVLVESPGYEPLATTAEGCGAIVARFERPLATNCALDPDRIGRAMTKRTRVITISNLHNPSGSRTSDEVLREVARIAATNDAWVLVDEVYAPFDTFTDARGVFASSARHLAPNVLAIGSLTKCYGVGDLRVGWLLGPAEIIRRAEDTFAGAVGHFPSPWLNVATRAFASIDVLATRARDQLSGKRTHVANWIASRKDVTWSAPASGLFGMAVHASAVDLLPAIEAGIDAHAVIVSAGTFFGAPNAFRLAWSIDRARLDEGLARLGRLLDAHVHS